MLTLISMPGGTEWLIIISTLIPAIFFLITQQKTLELIQPQNRQMEPTSVWLQLIPLFGLVWQFIVVGKISDSIRRELESRQKTIPDGTSAQSLPLTHTRPLYDLGLSYCVLLCCTIIPLVGFFIFFGALVCWIIYWVKLAEYKRMFESRQ